MAQANEVAAQRQRPGSRRLEASRRLDFGDASENEVPSAGSLRVQTKAFKAEATRCLSDVSEVLVNTGRHFGGRISVENTTDPRCQLMGDRSSEQSAYLFRIDHELCKSRITVSSRNFKLITACINIS